MAFVPSRLAPLRQALVVFAPTIWEGPHKVIQGIRLNRPVIGGGLAGGTGSGTRPSTLAPGMTRPAVSSRPPSTPGRSVVDGSGFAAERLVMVGLLSASRRSSGVHVGVGTSDQFLQVGRLVRRRGTDTDGA